MKLLFAASECYPFVKTGGLGDVAASLPKELVKNNTDVRVIIPKYGDIAQKYKNLMKHKKDFYIYVGWRNQYCGIESLEYEGITFYFVDNEYYFKRPGYYGYYDDGEKFVYFSKAVLETLKAIDFKPDVIHCHDWHTSLIPFLLKNIYNDTFYQNIKAVLTIHNLKYQGVFGKEVLSDLLSIGNEYYHTDCFEFHGAVNFLKAGITYADKVTTVSPSYSDEIKHAYFGEGLDGVLRKYENKLQGIINGIDYEVFNPETDGYIYKNYGDEYEIKSQNKLAFQKDASLSESKETPLIALVSRLVEQKGIDLIEAVIHEILSMNIQLVILGTGDYKYEAMFKNLVWQYPEKVRIFIEFDEEKSRKIYAASDMVLMPSRFEPCGITQMIAMKYGTIPIVRGTGGLKDTVTPYDLKPDEGSGFVFDNYNAHDFLYTIQKAVKIYNDKNQWQQIFNNAVNKDFSWRKPALEYLGIYQKLNNKSV